MIDPHRSNVHPRAVDDPLDPAARRRVNLVVLLVAAALLVAGVWLFTDLGRQQKAQECFEARRANCIPIDRFLDRH
jgi:hypothetical protein